MTVTYLDIYIIFKRPFCVRVFVVSQTVCLNTYLQETNYFQFILIICFNKLLYKSRTVQLAYHIFSMPDLAIRNIHNTPHLNYNLEPHSNEFAITSDSIWNSYSQSIITLPIIIGLLGITCVICFQFFWCCEACCCRKMTRAEGTTRQEILDWMKNKIESRKRVTLMFYILIAMVVISMATYYSAVVDVNDGFNTYYDALDYLDNTFTVLADEGDTLQQEGVYLSYNFGNSTCEAAPYLLDSVTVYQAYVSDYMSYVEPVQDPVSNAHDQGKYFNTWKMVVLWSVAGLIYITLILFFLSHLCRGKVMMHVAIGFSEIVLMFLIVSNTVWYAVLVRMAVIFV